MGAAIKAEELRGKLQRYYVEQVEVGDAGDFDRMTLGELKEFVAEEAQSLLGADDASDTRH
jgi:hypothetical protein